jgi:hypothetical protein
MKNQIQIGALIALTLSMAACANAPSATTTPNSSISSSATQFMFVQSAEDLKVDAEKSIIRLVKVDQQTLYFSDRPQRIAGHIKMPDYLAEWARAASSNNFGSDPPNATLSVYESGQPDNTIAVVKISQPVVDGNDLTYSYKLIEGAMPKGGGATALFIDWIGPGGGVGAGFHGVGAGGRGVGVR